MSRVSFLRTQLGYLPKDLGAQFERAKLETETEPESNVDHTESKIILVLTISKEIQKLRVPEFMVNTIPRLTSELEISGNNSAVSLKALGIH